MLFFWGGDFFRRPRAARGGGWGAFAVFSDPFPPPHPRAAGGAPAPTPRGLAGRAPGDLAPGSLGTEALFSHADGSFWRRHFNARFTPAGGDVIVWVFDAAGTRARTWRGAVGGS